MFRFLFCLPFFKFGSETEDQTLVIRKFIRKNVKKGKSIEEVDKAIIEKFGGGVIEYKELDYWYHQFYNGKKSMKDKRSPSDKAPLELLDLPNEMIHSIVSHLPIPDKLNIQMVSNRLGSLAALSLKFLEVNINESSMTFSDLSIFEGLEEIAVSLNLGYKQLKILLSRSELKLKILSMNADDALIANGSALRNMQRLFSSIHHQLHIKYFCSFGFLKDQLSLLPHFNPNVLRGLSVYEHHESDPFLETIRELVMLEQWNKLTTFYLNFRYRNPLVFYPVEYFMQFEEVGLSDLIRAINHSPEVFVWIRKLIMTSPNIDKLTAGFDISFRDVCSSLDPEIEIEWDDGLDGFAYWRTSRATFAIGRNHDEEELRELIIIKENGKNWGRLRTLGD